MAASPDSTSGSPSGGVVALVRDMIFASRIRGAADSAGVAAVVVRSADEAVRRAREGEPRLVLVDLDAADADPPALIARLKSEPETAECRIVAFVSHVRGEAIAEAREAGADRVLARSAFVRELPALLRGTDVADS